MPDLTSADIDRLLDLEAKATPHELISDLNAEWLTAEFDDHREFWVAARILARPLAERVRELEAENEKLRAALEKIAGETAATWVSDAARAALAQKEERP